MICESLCFLLYLSFYTVWIEFQKGQVYSHWQRQKMLSAIEMKLLVSVRAPVSEGQQTPLWGERLEGLIERRRGYKLRRKRKLRSWI